MLGFLFVPWLSSTTFQVVCQHAFLFCQSCHHCWHVWSNYFDRHVDWVSDMSLVFVRHDFGMGQSSQLLTTFRLCVDNNLTGVDSLVKAFGQSRHFLVTALPICWGQSCHLYCQTSRIVVIQAACWLNMSNYFDSLVNLFTSLVPW